jgi:putative peptidoglycan lipid II flippase
MSLVKNVFTVGVATLGSRVVGFARDVLMASYLGTGPVADAFVVAFRLPNLFRRLFAEGAFNAAFVPLFAKDLVARGPERARAFAEDAFAVMFWALAAFSALAMMAMPLLVWAMAPGFAADRAKFGDTVLFSQICFPYLMCMSLIALYGGVLNSLGRFAAAAWAPLLMNFVLVGGLLVVGAAGLANTREAGVAISISVALAGLAQLAMLVLATERAGYTLVLRAPRLTGEVKHMFGLAVPGVIAGGVQQINLVVGTVIASGASSAISWLYYADRLYQLPLGMVGIAIGIVLLPEMARQLREGDARVGHTQNRAFELAMMLTLPAAVALAVAPGPIIAGLFERGAFTPADTRAVAAALAAFSLGLPAFVLVKVFSPAFFAREDTRMPMAFAVASVAVNVAASFALWPLLGHVGIALATSLAGWVNALLLWGALWRRGHFAWDELLTRRLRAVAIASAAMGAAVFAAQFLVAPHVGGARSLLVNLLALGALCGSGLAVYAALLVLLGGADHALLRQSLRRRKGAAPPADDA